MLVTTLPITIPSADRMNVGKIYSPFVVTLLGKYLNATSVIALNSIGRAATNSSEEIEKYFSVLNKIGINPDVVWVDSSDTFRTFFREQIRRLSETDGSLEVSFDTIQSCSCGAVEIPLEHTRDSGKVYTVNNNQVRCKSCGTFTTSKQGTSVNLRMSDDFCINPDIYPGWAKAEANEFQRRFLGNRVRLTRFRNTDIKDELFNDIFFFDIDYFWSNYLAQLMLETNDFNATIVTSHQTLRQAMMVSWITRLIHPKSNVTILVTPTLTYRIKGQLIKRYFMNDRQNFDAKETRYMLVHSMNWKSKEVVVSSEVWYWIEHSINPINIYPNIDDIRVEERNLKSFLDTFNAQTVKNLMSSLRKQRRLTVEETLLHSYL